MRLCDGTVTLYNARVDGALRREVYAPTVLRGVSWLVRDAARPGGSGMEGARRHLLRVPADVDAGGSAYVSPGEYRRAGDAAGRWTLAPGDVIVAGEPSIDDPTPARLRALGVPCALVTAVTDNRRGLAAGRHWRVEGE